MGVKVYYYMTVAVLIGGLLFPQKGQRRKTYVILMAALHTFVCGWRYMYLTGDLRKYAWDYYTIADKGWFSSDVFNGGRNFLFFWLEKAFSMLTDGDFQVFLIFIAVVIELAVAVIIYRYSPRPWLSYLCWNCFGFYVFGFSAIKQALAMALIMAAFTGIMEDKPKRFYILTLLAGCIHAPALIFLPARVISRTRLNTKKLLLYAFSAGLIYLYRDRIVTFVSGFYYDEIDFMDGNRLGIRFAMIVGLIVLGIVLRGLEGKNFNMLLNLMVVTGVLQMFSGYDNVFTRLTDYYFQFLILYLPMMLYPEYDEVLPGEKIWHLTLTYRRRIAAILCAVLLSGLYYYKTNLSVRISNSADNYLNYRFCWEVRE